MSTSIHDAFEQKAQLDVFYADISKAFDCVNTSLLVKKLCHFPLSNNALRWFISYLTGRKQYVRIGSAKSDMFDVPSGVGQGTILGPLLFISFFNDSDNGIPDGVCSSNFADDKKLYTVVKTPADTLKLQAAIDNFLSWCSNNGLEVNAAKCKIISFSHKNSPIQHNYIMNDDTIQRVNEIKDLGVILDSKLNFNTHIEYICKKTMAALHFTRRQAQFFDKDIIKLLYMLLVRSNLEFACAIWSPHLPTHKETVESVQKQTKKGTTIWALMM